MCFVNFSFVEERIVFLSDWVGMLGRLILLFLWIIVLGYKVCKDDV